MPLSSKAVKTLVFSALLTVSALPVMGQDKLSGSPAGTPSAFQIEYSAPDQRIGIDAKGAPLQELLSSLNKVTGIEFIVPRAINPEVTLSFKDLPIERGLEQVFRQALGSAKNAAMVYEAVEGPDGKTQHVLTEVRVVKGEGGPKNPSASRPVTSSRSTPPTTIAPVRPRFSPQEMEARRAAKAAKKAEKEKAKEERRGRANRNSRSSSKGAPGSKANVGAPTADSSTPSAESGGKRGDK